VWGLAAGRWAQLFGAGGDWLLTRWSGGRIVVSGAGSCSVGRSARRMLLIDELQLLFARS